MRISSATLILGFFAVLFGLAGAYYAKQAFHSPVAVAPDPVEAEKPPTLVVPQAAVDLPAGRTITLGDIVTVSMTREAVKKANLSLPFMNDARQIVGRTLREPLAKGSTFQTTALYPEGLGPTIAERLPAGYRAITIPLTNRPEELALVSPGMMVDIVFRADVDEEQNIPETTLTLLERVEVLAIRDEIFVGTRNAAARGARGSNEVTVTLAVAPQQANALKIVEGHGTMALVVRSAADDSRAAEVTANMAAPQTLAGLLQIPPPEKPFTTEIYRRGQLTAMTFQNGSRTQVVADVAAVPSMAGSGDRLIPVSHRQANAANSASTDAKVAAGTAGAAAADCGCDAR